MRRVILSIQTSDKENYDVITKAIYRKKGLLINGKKYGIESASLSPPFNIRIDVFSHDDVKIEVER